MIKNFILDTNVLLHDPNSLNNFSDNNVFIPVEVVEELDKFKTETSTRGHHAREVHRQLDAMFPSETEMLKGFPKSQGGIIRVVLNPHLLSKDQTSKGMQRLLAISHDLHKPDNRILASAIRISEEFPQKSVLVTKDMNMRLKARHLGLEAEDYMNDKAQDDVLAPTEYERFHVSGNELQRFCSTGTLELSQERLEDIETGYFLLTNEETGGTKPAKYLGNQQFRVLSFPEHLTSYGGNPIKPRNLGQQFLLDAIFDSSTDLITVYGKAGTGKTILSVAAGLNQVQRVNYDKLMVTRSVIPMGKDIGFLPGTLEDKMRPWVQPIYDAVETIMTRSKPEQFRDKPQRKKTTKTKKEENGNSTSPPNLAKPYDKLIEAGVLEVEALSHIRGRSIPRSFFILDEAQNITPHEAKTIVTRMGEGSKLLLIGDPAQIDNPYVDLWSNGLVYTRNKFKGNALATHVNLIKGERSQLAEVAANLM